MENTWVGLLVPTVALKFAVDGKIFAAGPLTAWEGLPEMARPNVPPIPVIPPLKGEPGISTRFPDTWST